MGQYYKCIVKKESTDGHTYNNVYEHELNSSKLLVFAHMGNSTMKTLASVIHNQPCRIAIVGDYADEFPLYALAYLEGHEFPTTDEAFNLEELDIENLYLVNHDKRLYINLKHYCIQNKIKTSEEYDENYDCVVSPFILFAVGNGRGGGDYQRDLPDFNYVGSWAWDSVEITDEKPSDRYESEMYWFQER